MARIKQGVGVPRGPRLDAFGTLHHVIVRGIEKRNIVDDDKDREDFVNRMGGLAMDTGNFIYAWALMTNHAHILLRSGNAGLPAFMRRFLTGYAASYNRRHSRHGHVFQNRYKSIVCEENPYFMELVRYIHLNPLRAGLVENPAKLDGYKWCDHAVVIGRRKNEWQDRKYVLKWFGQKEADTKKTYKEFIEKGIGHGRRPDLTGGGLIRSMGGWSVVKSMRKSGAKEKGDERILGSGEFVSEVIRHSEENVKYQLSAMELQKRIKDEIENHCGNENVPAETLRSGSRRPPLPKLRRTIALKLVNGYGVSLAETARQLGISTSAVAQILRREKGI